MPLFENLLPDTLPLHPKLQSVTAMNTGCATVMFRAQPDSQAIKAGKVSVGTSEALMRFCIWCAAFDTQIVSRWNRIGLMLRFSRRYRRTLAG